MEPATRCQLSLALNVDIIRKPWCLEQIDKERLRAELAEAQTTLERSGRWPEERRAAETRLMALEEEQSRLRLEKEVCMHCDTLNL